MHATKMPRAGCSSPSSSICTCRPELWHQSQHAAPSYAQHFVKRQRLACLVLVPGNHTNQDSNGLQSSQHTVSLFIIFFPSPLPVFCRTGLKRSPSAYLFQTWTSCEQLLPPSARCFGNSWKMFTLVASAALSRKESGWRSWVRWTGQPFSPSFMLSTQQVCNPHTLLGVNGEIFCSFYTKESSLKLLQALVNV